MYTLYIIAIIALAISLFFDKGKTVKALKIAWKKLNKILASYIKLLIILSVVLLISDRFIIEYLGESTRGVALFLALILGSLTMMPGFVAYPLAGILVDKGVSFMVVSAFITTLMMVGVVTYPVEKAYFGTRATIVRNGASLVIALIIAIVTGIFYGEVF